VIDHQARKAFAIDKNDLGILREFRSNRPKNRINTSDMAEELGVEPQGTHAPPHWI